MTPDAEAQARPKRGFEFPTAFTILFLLAAVLAAATWVLPAGQYDRVMDEALGREVAVRGTYKPVEANPQTPIDVVTAMVGGFYNPVDGKTRAVDVMLFVLFIGGFMGVVGKTRAVDAAIIGVMRRLEGREHWMIPILMGLFALGGTTFGMAEETLPFIALLVPVMMRAGYDSVVAVSVVLIGSTIGQLGSTTNPFSTIIASNASSIPFTEGLELRLVLLGVAWLICVIFVMRYAARVRKDASQSLLADKREEIEAAFHSADAPPSFFSWRLKLVMIVFALTFGVMIWGVATQGWWMGEMTALFLAAAILVAIVGGVSEKDLVDSFIDGARALLGVALVIGIARGALVVMEDGRIIDTILHAGDMALAGLPALAFINGAFFVEILMAFVVPSSSGQAVLTMPVLAPLADFAEVERSLVVTAYQAGNGVTGFITPTSAVLMGSLAVGRVPFQRWLKFVWPLVLIITVLVMVVLSVGHVLA